MFFQVFTRFSIAVSIGAALAPAIAEAAPSTHEQRPMEPVAFSLADVKADAARSVSLAGVAAGAKAAAHSEAAAFPTRGADRAQLLNRARSSAAMKWELAYLALSAVDVAETVDCLHRDVCYETNPLFGKHPKASTLVLAKIGGGLLHYAAFRAIAHKNPTAALRFSQLSVGLQGSVVFLNAAFIIG